MAFSLPTYTSANIPQNEKMVPRDFGSGHGRLQLTAPSETLSKIGGRPEPVFNKANTTGGSRSDGNDWCRGLSEGRNTGIWRA